MVTFIIIVNLLLAFKLGWDWYAKNKKKRIINHELSAAIDLTIYFVSALCLFGIDLAGWFILALSYRWLMFDLLFNLINGDKWNHYGTSSKIDRLMLKTDKYHIVIKLFFFASSILYLIYK